jgi:Phosphodiester glycosidase
MLSFASLIGVIVLPAVSPSAGARGADLLRSVLGPRPVATLESVSFQIQDTFNRFLSSVNGGKPQISIDQQNLTQQSAPIPSLLLRRQPPALPTPTSAPADSPTAPIPNAQNTAVSAPGTDVVSAFPQVGWQNYGPHVNGQPAMAQALLTPDPQRPYAGIALVRIDLSKLQLHMEPGFLEPSHTATVQNAIPGLGMIPATDQSVLAAGFNGGFRAINGQYGMVINGVMLLPPLPGIATVAIYKDGHVQIGTWGQDMFPGIPDMIALRQNCPPLLQNGQINPQVSIDNRALWGNTVGNSTITWRTGLGITQDGSYLIYAVGNGTSVATLAQALQDAGAYNAMQLDINRHYAHFVTYQPSPGSSHLTAVQLLDQMESDPTLYLVAHSRDFFYLTTR